MIIGLALGGFGRGIINGFPTADAMRGGIRAFPEHETEVTDIISSMCSMVFGVAVLIVPNIAATLNSFFGFRSLYDVIALVFLVVMSFFGVSSVCDMKKEKVQKKELL